VEAVVDAAIAILSQEGREAVTMRRLADDLGLSPMGLYRYVHDKDELLDRIVDTVLRKVDLDVAGEWRERLVAITGRARRVLLEHPGVAQVCVDRPTPVLGVAMIYERLLGALKDAALDDKTAMIALDTITMFLFGSVLWESARTKTERERLLRAVDASPEAALALVRQNTALTDRDPDEYFERGLALILDGISECRP
jgi:AcrR family transcriptional regulator